MRFVKSFPARLAWARKREGLTQSALSRRAGLHPEVVGNIERGTQQIGLHALISLADALDVSLDFLLGRWKKEPLREAPAQEPSEPAREPLLIGGWGAIDDAQRPPPEDSDSRASGSGVIPQGLGEGVPRRDPAFDLMDPDTA